MDTKRQINMKQNKITQRLENDINGLGSRPKLETSRKQAQDPINIKTKLVARTKWSVYSCLSLRVAENQE